MASELGVQTIQHTNGTDALTVASDGVVTAPQYIKQSAVPSFWAHKTDGLAGVNTNIVYNVVNLNVGNCYNSTTGYFTAPVDGIYTLTACFTGNNTIEEHQLNFYKNTTDTRLTSSRISNTSTAFNSNSTTIVIELTAGDSVFTRCTSGAIYSSTGGPWTWFCGHLIG